MPAEVIEPDLASQLADRVRHAQQFLEAALRCIREARELMGDEDEEEN